MQARRDLLEWDTERRTSTSSAVGDARGGLARKEGLFLGGWVEARKALYCVLGLWGGKCCCCVWATMNRLEGAEPSIRPESWQDWAVWSRRVE